LILAGDESYKKSSILLNDKILSINELLIKHFKKYNSDVNNLDFVLLNAFLGNDYIPKISELSPKKIWESYSLNIEKDIQIIKIQKINNVIKYEFNKELLINIFSDCIGKISKTKIIKNNNIYDKDLYKNYFDGVLWTTTMYNLGRCYNYEYICIDKKPIDIINLIIYMYDFDINNFKYEETNPIPSVLCGILLLPENASKELIDKRYKKFIDNEDTKKMYNKDFKISVDFIKNIQTRFEKFESTF